MKIKFFDIDYLANEELTDEDLHYLFDTDSLIYSLILAEFNLANYEFTPNEVRKICKSDRTWPYKYYWSNKKQKQFLNTLINVYKNIYCYSTEKCLWEAQNFLTLYGLTNKMQKNKKITKLDD